MPQQHTPAYTPLGPLGEEQLRLRFSGPFEGREVSWDALFVTRRHYRAARPEEAGIPPNFIEIGPGGPDGQGLTVMLDVAAFDAATTLKTVIMVRQYRRLRRGRHAFGTLSAHE